MNPDALSTTQLSIPQTSIDAKALDVSSAAATVGSEVPLESS